MGVKLHCFVFHTVIESFRFYRNQNFPDFRNGTPKQSIKHFINLLLIRIHLEQDFLFFWIAGQFEGHFLHRLRQFSNASGTDRDVFLVKTVFEFFVDGISDKRCQNMRFDSTASAVIHRADSQVCF